MIVYDVSEIPANKAFRIHVFNTGVLNFLTSEFNPMSRVNELLSQRHAELPARSLGRRGFGISKLDETPK
jgi:hypothetical protein